MPVIVADGLRKRFGDTTAVHGLSFSVAPGSVLGLLGPNGAGKTTTIRMIVSILLPDAGSLRILGLRSALEARDRIGYLPGALDFLRAVAAMDKKVLLVTNSHPDTLHLKDAVTGLGDYFDGLYSSHDYGHAKESQAFWHALQDEVDFDVGTTLFVDDSQPVLKSARDYGASMLVTVTRPDSLKPVRNGSEFLGVEGVRDLIA